MLLDTGKVENVEITAEEMDMEEILKLNHL